jgi:nucleoid DNA-binding protein/nucleoid-associated protein YgaU
MKKKISFQDFVARVAEHAGTPRRLAHEFIKDLGAVIDAGLERDGHVRLARLGTFRLGKRAEHMGVNPQTRDRMVIPEHTRVLFRPAFALANQVNAEYNHLQPEPLKRTGNPADNPGDADPEPEAEPEAKPEAVPPTEEKPPEEEKPPAKKKPPTPPPPPSKSPTRTYTIIGAVVVAVIIILFFVFRGGDEETVAPEPEASPPMEEVEPQPPAEPESVTEFELEPEPEPEFTYEPEPVEEEYIPAPSTVYNQGTPAQIHVVHRSDNLWNLADFYYQEATFWPLILQANKPLRFNPDLLFTGIDLVVPMLEGIPDDLTFTDPDNLANAYHEAFESYRKLGKPDAEDYLRRSERFSQ